MAIEKLINGAGRSTLNASIDATQTSLVVVSATPFPTINNFRIVINNEIMKVTAVAGTTFTVVRAQEGTTGNTHASGANVDYELTNGALAAIRAEMYSVGTYANRPSSARTGAIYAATDGFAMSRYSGSAWEEWGPTYPITPPSTTWDQQWSWYQQGSATITRDGASWIMKLPAETSGLVRMLVKTKPSVPYTIEFGLRMLIWPSDYSGWGLIFKNAANAHTHFGATYHSANGDATHLMVDKYDNAGAYDLTYVAIGSSQRMSALNWPYFFRITEDATYRISQFSQDGVFWYTYHSVAKADYLGTTTQIGFGGQVSNNHDSYAEIFHYKEY